jgi:hypothetical protein
MIDRHYGHLARDGREHAKSKFFWTENLRERGFCKPSDGLEPSTASLPWNVAGNRWQPVATELAYFCGFNASSDCS